MNRLLDFTGGKPDFNIDDMLWNDEAAYGALHAIMEAFGVSTNENFIISGCETNIDPGEDIEVTAGYIYLNGEILEVEAQTVDDGGTVDLYKYVKATTYDTGGDVTFNDGTPRQTWQKNRGIVTAATSPILTTELDVVYGDRLLTRTQGQIVTKVIDIGAWNMSTYATKTVNISTLHEGSFLISQIVGIRAYVYSDDSNLISRPLNSFKDGVETWNGGVASHDTADVILRRTTGGDFNSTSYNNAVMNRGYLLVDYKLY